MHTFPENIDAMLLSSSVNVGYETEFWGSYGRVLLFPTGKKILITDSRYAEIAKEKAQNGDFLFLELGKNPDFWKTLCAEHSILRLGIESEDISLARFETMKKGFEGVDLIPVSEYCTPLRICKTSAEKKMIQKAASIADTALAYTVSCFSEGITEKELAWIFEKTAREQFGADALSFDTIVAFGSHSACAHHFPTDKKLEWNTPILIDCGVKYQHYCSDMTRCFWFGDTDIPEYAEWKTTYDLVLQAQQEGITQMKKGNSISSAEKKAREIFSENEQYFIHSFGHGVGLEIHESPHVSAKNDILFEKDMVVTAEPGLYFPEKFGIRIEDLLYITDENPYYFSRFPK